jgi:cardiolipin synthase
MGLPNSLLRQLTIANQLTLLRLFAVPAFALALLNGSLQLAFWLFVGATITDKLDGLAARRWGQSTSLGMILDPAADKLMMLVAYVILALPDHPRSFPEFELRWHVPAWLTLLIVLRDLLIVIVAGAIAMTHSQLTFPPSPVGKWAAGTAMICAAVFVAGSVWPLLSEGWLTAGVSIVTATTVGSGIDYLLRTRRMLQALHDRATKS